MDVSLIGAGDVKLGSVASDLYPYTRRVDKNINITLEALPVPGYHFTSWIGDVTSSENPLNIRAEKEITITAIFTADFREFASEDEMLNLTVPEGVSIWDEEGNLVSEMAFTIDEDPPLLDENYEFIGQPYILQPDGATFDQLATLTWSYDPANIPSKVAEEDIYIAYYNEITGEWVELSSIVNAANDSVTASIEHFTTFAMVAYVPLLPDDFTISSLDIQPTEVNVGEPVAITAMVSNNGDDEDSCTVKLKIDGVLVETEELTIDGNTEETVTFTIIEEEVATYSVDVNGLTNSFNVKEVTINWFILAPVIAGLIVLIGFLTAKHRGQA